MVAPPVCPCLGLELVLCVDAHCMDELLMTFKELARSVHGCTERGAFRDLGDPQRLRWVERWSSERGLNEYLASESFRVLMGAATLLARVEALHVFRDWPSRAASIVTRYISNGEPL